MLLANFNKDRPSVAASEAAIYALVVLSATQFCCTLRHDMALPLYTNIQPFSRAVYRYISNRLACLMGVSVGLFKYVENKETAYLCHI